MLETLLDRPRVPLWIRLPLCAVGGCVLAVLALAALLYFCQHALIYHPRPYSSIYQKVWPRQGVELEYSAGFGKQTAFYIPLSKDPPTRIWLAFSGNGSLALDWTGLLVGYPANGDAFLLVDYPGYGKNAGDATIDRTRASAEGALSALSEHLKQEEEQMTICVIGHSLGAAAGLDFAARHRVERVVLAAPFTTLREEAATIVGSQLARLLVENYDNRENIRTVLKRSPQVRIDIFHGSADHVIPVRMGRALAHEFSMIDFHEVRGAGHDTVMNDARVQIIAAMTRE